MPNVDMRVIMKTPLLMGFESFASDDPQRKKRISNTTIMQKDESRKIKLMDLPFLKKKGGTILKSLPEEENMLESSLSFKPKEKKLFDKKKDEDSIEIPLEGSIKQFK